MADTSGVDEFSARVVTADSFIGSFYVTYKSVSGTYNMISSDSFLACDTANTPVTINLITGIGNEGKTVIVKDSGGNSSVNNITIAPNGGDTVDGQNLWYVNGNWDSISLISDGTGKWLIN